MKIELKNNKQLALDINKLIDSDKAKILSRFFKTAPGQYGAGDQFLGITVPLIRGLEGAYPDMSDSLVVELLSSSYHEVRLLGVLAIVSRYQKAKNDKLKEEIVSFYLKHRYALNNWDLVDLSVYKVWGDYLLHHPEERKILFQYAKSKNLWERRMAIVATLALIKSFQFKEILELVRMLKEDREDLTQKALGWMLREVGKKDEDLLKDYLNQEASSLARTTLRYAIERLTPAERQYYLKLKSEISE